MKGGLILCLVGCGDDTSTTIVDPGDLSPPLGLQSVTGDTQVKLLWWCSNFDDDLLGYKVYYAEGDFAGGPLEELPGTFTVRDSLPMNAPCNQQVTMDITGLTNGTTYSFLVVAVKDSWNEISHTSNVVSDTPRRESALTVTLYAKQEDATLAGYELSDFTVVDCSDLDVDYNTGDGDGDIMCERFNPGAGTRAWIDGINGAFVQDLGFMDNWDDADAAPPSGYAGAGHSVEALVGHVYAVWTVDDYYGKIRVMDIDHDYEWIKIKAAFQPQAGSVELGN